MKSKIFHYLLIGFFAFLVSCDPMVEDDYNLGLPPKIEDIQYSISFDENNGTATFESQNQEAVAVWYFPTSDPSSPVILTGNKVSKKFIAEGTYSISVAIYNKAGMSETKAISFDAPGANPTFMIADKTWVWDKDNAGHIGNGPADGDSPQWWVAAPNEQDAQLYDDEMTFNSDGTFVLNTNGFVLCNEDAASAFGIEGATAGVIVPYTQETSQAWKLEIEGDKLFLSFTEGGFPSYIPSGDWATVKYEVLELSETKLSLKLTRSWGAFFMTFKTK